MKSNSNNKLKLNNSGFSLAEIMIVLVIIGAIMGLILPKINEGRDNANVRNTKIKMTDIENKLNEYQADCSKYPSSLEFLVNDVSECKNWTSNKNNKKLMKDEWGTDFQYEVSENGYNLMSLGKDKKEGGSGPERDFYSENSVANEDSN